MNQQKKSNKQANRSKGQSVEPKKTMSDRQIVPHLSKCVVDYNRSRVNPFTGPQGACIPNTPALMSRKARTWAKGVMEVGSGTIGFVWCDPQRGAVNDGANVNYSTNAYAGTTFALPATAGVVAASTNADYAAASIAENLITFRVVSSGLRIRYVGTELNRGGYVVALMDTNHNSLLNRNISDLDAEINSKRFPVTREWITVVSQPVRDADDDFGTLPAATPVVASLSWYMGIMASSPAGALGQFEWEFYGNYEYQGATVRGQTPSHVDVVGYGASAATATFTKHLQPYQGHAHTKEKPFNDDVKKTLASSFSGLVEIGKGAAELYSGNWIKGGMDIITGITDLF